MTLKGKSHESYLKVLHTKALYEIEPKLSGQVLM